MSERPTSAILAMLALKTFVDKYPERLGATTTTAAKPNLPGVVGAGMGAGPVQLATRPGEVSVTKATPASLEVGITIGPGHHINANKPGPDFLVPLRIELTGCEGLRAVVEYPEGERYEGELADGVMFIHNGSIRVPVRIEQTGKVTGRPQLVIQYQACTDKLCMEPKTETLPLRILFER
jgi:uncharacterized protein